MKNMMKMLMAFVLMLVFAVSNYAFSGGIFGTVNDANNNWLPAPYVTVYAVNVNNSSLSYYAFTDANGEYAIYHMQDETSYYVYAECPEPYPYLVYVEYQAIVPRDLTVACSSNKMFSWLK